MLIGPYQQYADLFHVCFRRDQERCLGMFYAPLANEVIYRPFHAHET